MHKMMTDKFETDDRDQTFVKERYITEVRDETVEDKTTKAKNSANPDINMSPLAENVLEVFSDEDFQDSLKPTMNQMMSEFINNSVSRERERYGIEALLESNKILVETLENKQALIEQLTDTIGQYGSAIATLMSSEKRLIRTFLAKCDSDAQERNKEIPVRRKSNIREPNFRKSTAIATVQDSLMEEEVFHDNISSKETVVYSEDKFIESTWRNLADQEIDEGRGEGVGRRHGTHAVLCIDTSGSMNEGNAWSQVKQFYNEFLDGMVQLKEQDSHHDNIAVVTFGAETKVQKRLTKNLNSLRGILDDITPKGPSPLFGGLVMAAAATQTSKYSFAIVNYMHVRPKIILVTDGRPTEISLLDGPDVADPKKLEQTRNTIVDEVAKLTREQIDLHCIYVGINADRRFLKTLQSKSVKELMSYRDGEKMALYTVIKCMREGDQSFVRCAGEDDVMRSLDTPMMPGSEQRFETMTSDQASSSANDLSKFLGQQSQPTSVADKTSLSDLQGRTGNKTSTITMSGDRLVNVYNEMHDKNHPPVGTRVERGEDWRWGNQDNGRIGTIIGHATDPEDDGQCWVHVEWDDDTSPEKGRRNVYRYKMGEDMEEDVREAGEDDRRPPPGNILAVGCRVIPGERFKGDPGNKKGTVIRFHGTRAEVRWNDGSRGKYRFEGRAAEILPMMNPERTANVDSRTNHEEIPSLPTRGHDCRDVPRIEVTEKHIQHIAQTIPSGWEVLGTELDVPNVKMNHIARDFRDSIVLQIVNMLTHWMRNAENPKLDVLVTAIRECGVNFDKERLRNIISRIRKENEK